MKDTPVTLIKNDTSVDGCSLLDWTNIAEDTISGTIGGVITTAFVGITVFIHKKTSTPPSKKKRKHKKRRKKKRR